MKTSVVLSAYNGEKFIEEQLDSIRVQTVPVDEVIIMDDCSTDNTVNICKDFISKYNLSNWYIEVNIQNKGFVQNFYDGFQKASGDIIFVCDQDDKWRSNKVERMKYYFTCNPDALSICSAFSRFWEDKIITPHVVSPNRKRRAIKRITPKNFAFFYSYLGMSTVFKKDILKYNYSLCIQNITYDVAINFISLLYNGLYYLDEVLVDRRSYTFSTSNSDAINITNQYFEGNHRLYVLSVYMSTLKSFCSYIDRLQLEYEGVVYFKYLIAETQKRINALKKHSVYECIKLLFKTDYIFSAKRIVGDIIYIIKNRD